MKNIMASAPTNFFVPAIHVIETYITEIENADERISQAFNNIDSLMGPNPDQERTYYRIDSPGRVPVFSWRQGIQESMWFCVVSTYKNPIVSGVMLDQEEITCEISILLKLSRNPKNHDMIRLMSSGPHIYKDNGFDVVDSFQQVMKESLENMDTYFADSPITKAIHKRTIEWFKHVAEIEFENTIISTNRWAN